MAQASRLDWLQPIQILLSKLEVASVEDFNVCFSRNGERPCAVVRRHSEERIVNALEANQLLAAVPKKSFGALAANSGVQLVGRRAYGAYDHRDVMGFLVAVEIGEVEAPILAAENALGCQLKARIAVRGFTVLLRRKEQP